MIGSQGINNLSRAAGDESLQHLQRVNKDAQEEQEKGGRGRGDKKSDSDEGKASDSYERAAEDINPGSPTQVPAPQQATTQAGDRQQDSAARDVSDSDIKSRKKSGPANDKTNDDDVSHIDLVG